MIRARNPPPSFTSWDGCAGPPRFACGCPRLSGSRRREPPAQPGARALLSLSNSSLAALQLRPLTPCKNSPRTAQIRHCSTRKLHSYVVDSDVNTAERTPTARPQAKNMLRASRLLRVELRLGAARRRLSLAYSPPLTGADYLHTPKFWTGLEPEKAPGFDAERNCLASLKAPDLRERGPELRDTLEDYFENGWALTEVLFSSLRGPEAYYRPPAHGLRHPLVFYYGHPAVRSRRPVVWRRLHAIDATHVHLTMTWVVSFSILRPFGPSRDAPRRSLG